MVKKSQRIWIILVGLFIALVAAFSVPKKEESEVHAAADLTISTAVQLDQFRSNVEDGNSYVGQTIELVADIDLFNYDWRPIGGYNSANAFKGTFNGNKHTVRNVTVNGYKEIATNYNDLGFFGYLDGATITNLTVENIVCETTKSSQIRAGCLVGYANNSTINNCHITKNGDDNCIVNVYADSSNYMYAGGFAGYIKNSTTINCSSLGDVRATGSSGNVYVGGFVGNSDSNIARCYSNNSVTASRGNSAKDLMVGGFVGYYNSSSSTVIDSYSNSNVIATDNCTGTSTAYSLNVGGFVGATGNHSISNCYATGTVTTGGPTGGYESCAGGFVGRQGGAGSISKSYATGTVVGKNKSYLGVGGFAGSQAMAGTVKLNYCYATGSASATGSNAQNIAGGLVGVQDTSSNQITNSYAIGDVTISQTGTNDAGRLIGYKRGTTVTSTYTLDTSKINGTAGAAKIGDKSYDSTKKTAAQFASGEVAYLLNGNTSTGTLNWYQSLDNGIGPDAYPKLESSRGTVYSSTFCDHSSSLYSNYDRGSATLHSFDRNGFCTNCGAYEPPVNWQESDAGTSSNPYQISNAGQLYWFACVVNNDTLNCEDYYASNSNNVNACAELTDNITIPDGRLWKPIGISNYEYRGSFNGQGNKISGVKINTSGTSSVGFFGYVRKYADLVTIQNVGLENIDYNVVNMSDLGGLVGRVGISSGINIENCYVRGKIVANSHYTSHVGGFVGEIITAGTTINDCYTDENIFVQCSGGEVCVGSIGGQIAGTGTFRITNSYAKGTIEGECTGKLFLGGFLGWFGAEAGSSIISDCYSSSTVIATKNNAGECRVGGFLGTFEALFPSMPYTLNSAVINCYSTGSVTTTNNTTDTTDYRSATGGFVGYIRAAKLIENCYAIGDVTLTSGYKGTVAGFVGFVHNNIEDAGTTYCNIKKCYATGNVTHNNSSTSGTVYTGGFAGDAWPQNSSITFENCYTHGGCTLITSSNVETRTGGFVANMDSGYINNCYATNYLYITSGGTKYAGKLIGATESVSPNNCYNLSGNTVSYRTSSSANYSIASYIGSKYKNGTLKTAAEFASGEVTCRLNNASGIDPISGGTTWYQSIDNGIGPDAYPLLESERGTVYSAYRCGGGTTLYYTNINPAASNNDPWVPSEGDHIFDNNGFCTRCGAYEAPTLNSNNYYEIDNAGKLYWFAAVVNNELDKCDNAPAERNASACGVLMDDIVINEDISSETARFWKPIGTYRSDETSGKPNAYRGQFNGNNHTISGMKIKITGATSAVYAGLFGYVYGDYISTRIQNVGVINSSVNVSNSSSTVYAGGLVGDLWFCDLNNNFVENNVIVNNSTGTVYAGGLAGGITSNNSNSIVSSYSKGSVNVSGSNNIYEGGLIGYPRGFQINNNYSTSFVTLTSTGSSSNYARAGGLLGFFNDSIAQLKNSHAIGNIEVNSSTASTKRVGKLVGDQYNDTVSNLYYLESSTITNNTTAGNYIDNTSTLPGATSKTAAEFASGEVACRLNNTTGTDPISGGTTWYQSIDNELSPHDAYPLLNSERGTVYSAYRCGGNTTLYYTNINPAASNNDPWVPSEGDHIFDNNGFCTRCGVYEAPTLNSDNYYKIDNAGKLYWFAAVVNNELDKCANPTAERISDANAKLTADINVNPGITITENTDPTTVRYWTPIGTNYYNTFNGNFDGDSHTISGLYVNSEDAKYVGLIGYAEYTREFDTQENKKISNVGIENSYLYSNNKDSYVGGICGCVYGYDIENCYNTAKVSGCVCVGGICNSFEGKITNCYNVGDLGSINKPIIGSASGICGISDIEHSLIEVENCYNYGNLYADNAAGIMDNIYIWTDNPDYPEHPKYIDGIKINNCYCKAQENVPMYNIWMNDVKYKVYDNTDSILDNLECMYWHEEADDGYLWEPATLISTRKDERAFNNFEVKDSLQSYVDSNISLDPSLLSWAQGKDYPIFTTDQTLMVNVSWGDMKFAYKTPTSSDPTSGWSIDTDENKITFENHSNGAKLRYNDVYGNVTGVTGTEGLFTHEEGDWTYQGNTWPMVESPDMIESVSSGIDKSIRNSWLTISGTISGIDLNDYIGKDNAVPIGQITITISG